MRLCLLNYLMAVIGTLLRLCLILLKVGRLLAKSPVLGGALGTQAGLLLCGRLSQQLASRRSVQ